MEREKLLVLLDELFEQPAGSLRGPERLEELGNWDSLSMMMFIGLAREHCGTTLSPRVFINCRTVDDLLKLADNGGS